MLLWSGFDFNISFYVHLFVYSDFQMFPWLDRWDEELFPGCLCTGNVVCAILNKVYTWSPIAAYYYVVKRPEEYQFNTVYAKSEYVKQG